MHRLTLWAVTLAWWLAVAAPVQATSLAFEFGSGGAGFSIEAAPPEGPARRDAARGESRGRTGGWGWERGGGERQVLPDQEIVSALRRQGYRNVSNLRRRGAIYQAQAHDPAGTPVGLVLSARSGAILNVYRTR